MTATRCAAVLVLSLPCGVFLSGRAAADPSQGEPCEPGWVHTFGSDPGMDDIVYAVASFDDGSGAGPRVYAGGRFTTVEGVPLARLAVRDGDQWSPVGGGVNGTVSSLLVFDDGSGPALYVGGGFTSAGGVSANGIARWDGVSWSALGTGMLPGAGALAVFDDGTGPALYAGGSFTSAGGVAANGIAKWDGSTWSPLGAGVTGASNGVGPVVRSLAVFDDGGGPALFASGVFLAAGGVTANHVARWDGASWSPLAGGMTGCAYPQSCSVVALTVFDDGGGEALYAGGKFFSAGGVAAQHVARWDGLAWQPVGAMLGDYEVYALAGFDDGGGPALYVGGDVVVVGVAAYLLKWTGNAWASPGGGVGDLGGRVHDLCTHDDGSGPVLVAGGNFEFVGGIEAHRVASYAGGNWSAFGVQPLEDTVRTVAWLDPGNGGALYAGGDFESAGGIEAQHVARWDGAGWSALGSGMNHDVLALAMFDDGSGPALHAAGNFTNAGGTTVSRVAKWDGTSWSRLGTASFDGAIRALAVLDDGSGPLLCVGGSFTTVSGVTGRRFAKWNGTTWTVQSGGFDGDIRALTVFDDGSGPALYAGGAFHSIAGAPNANGIARLVSGTTWASLGGGLNGANIHALAVFDDGTGPALYAGGTHVTTGGDWVHGVWRWSPGWMLLGSGTNDAVHALAVFDDGGGPALYAGGLFTSAGGGAANRIARWDGALWSALGSGTSGAVESLASFGGAVGADASLFAGGDFATSPAGDRYLARWSGCDTVPPTLACPPTIVRAPSGGSGEVVTFTVTAVDDRDPSPEIVCVPPSGSVFPAGATLVTCTATDDAGNSSVCQFEVVVQTKVRRR